MITPFFPDTNTLLTRCADNEPVNSGIAQDAISEGYLADQRDEEQQDTRHSEIQTYVRSVSQQLTQKKENQRAMIAWQLASDSNRIQTAIGTQVDELSKGDRDIETFLLSIHNDVKKLHSIKKNQPPPNERIEIDLQLARLKQQYKKIDIMISNSDQKLPEIILLDSQDFLTKLNQWRSLFKNQAPEGATPELEAVDALLAKANKIKNNPAMLSPYTTMESSKLLRKIFFDNGLDKKDLLKVRAVSNVFKHLSSQTQETLPF
jgi:hypothetical protein